MSEVSRGPRIAESSDLSEDIKTDMLQMEEYMPGISSTQSSTKSTDSILDPTVVEFTFTTTFLKIITYDHVPRMDEERPIK